MWDVTTNWTSHYLFVQKIIFNNVLYNVHTKSKETIIILQMVYSNKLCYLESQRDDSNSKNVDIYHF